MASAIRLNWRESLITQLQERNKLQTYCFEELITQSEHTFWRNLTITYKFVLIVLDNKLFDNANALRAENLHLSVQIEKLKFEGASSHVGNGTSSSGDSKLHDRIQHLEQKLMAQQEELTELHRRKGENAQQIIDLNAKLQEKEKQLAAKDARYLVLRHESCDRYCVVSNFASGWNCKVSMPKCREHIIVSSYTATMIIP